MTHLRSGSERQAWSSSLCHSLCAATATGWNTSGCWRGAASTASGRSPSAPSTVWWTSTGLTASPWIKWCASETPPRRPSGSLGATLIRIPTKPAPGSPSTQPTGRPLPTCWILGYHKTPPPTLMMEVSVYCCHTHVVLTCVCLQKTRLAHALCDYTPPHTAHLHFLRGDIIDLLDCSSSLSWRGRCRGRVGVFPPACVQPLHH